MDGVSHIEPLADDRLQDKDGLLVIPASEVMVTDALVRAMREAASDTDRSVPRPGALPRPAP